MQFNENDRMHQSRARVCKWDTCSLNAINSRHGTGVHTHARTLCTGPTSSQVPSYLPTWCCGRQINFRGFLFNVSSFSLFSSFSFFTMASHSIAAAIICQTSLFVRLFYFFASFILFALIFHLFWILMYSSQTCARVSRYFYLFMLRLRRHRRRRGRCRLRSFDSHPSAA